MVLKAPFPYFGGKSAIAPIIWARLGNVANYVEPFAGSLAVLLARPHEPGIETVNDKDGFICNFWRALSHNPDEVARWADWPVSECDLHARHAWLVGRRADITRRLEGDPDWFDAKVAGWWVWGMSIWIGSGFCSGQGPWQPVEVDGVRQLVHLGDSGRGINRKLVHLGDGGRGINRKLVHLGNSGQGVQRRTQTDLAGYMRDLAARLRRVRVCCGDWSRVCGPTPTIHNGLTGVFLDPPYANDLRADGLYTEDKSLSTEIQAWCLENQANPLLRTALCGYEGEYNLPGWDQVAWKARGGYSNQGDDNDNPARERVWFSPHCLRPDASSPEQLSLFQN